MMFQLLLLRQDRSWGSAWGGEAGCAAGVLDWWGEGTAEGEADTRDPEIHSGW